MHDAPDYHQQQDEIARRGNVCTFAWNRKHPLSVQHLADGAEPLPSCGGRACMGECLDVPVVVKRGNRFRSCVCFSKSVGS